MKTNRNLSSRVLLVTLPLLCAGVFLIFFTLMNYFHGTVENIEDAEIRSIEYQDRMIRDTFYAIMCELDFLSGSRNIPVILGATESAQEVRNREADDYARLVEVRQIYDQIRLLDKTGQEIIRVNYTKGGSSRIIPPEELQNKGDRYYFSETMALDNGEIFISPFDLNIEQGKIEIPEKPMIRFGTPIQGRDGQKLGILIINYLGIDLLDKMAEFSSLTEAEYLLGNEDGQWIIAPEKIRNWDFMYDIQSDNTLGNSFPEQQYLFENGSGGQFSTDDFLYTFSKVRLSPNHNRFWYLFSRKSYIELKETRRRVLATASAATVILILILWTILTRWIHAVEARMRYEKKLIKADNDKSAFLAHMSHEIRNPMNAVVGLNRLLKETELTEKQQDYLVRASRASSDLVNIVNDILDFSKIEAGKLALESIDFNLPDLIDHIIELARINMGDKDLEFRKEIASDIPVFVNGDPLRLRQVLTNLMTNAVKFTEEGSITLSCSIVRQNDRESEFLFSVRDTGIGLTEEQSRRLFQTFSQADISTSRTHGGTGLGLSICRQLVQLMGGDVEVSSSPGSGSTFSFSIILAYPEVVESKETDEEIPFFNRGLKVLVVEDNEINQYVAREILEKEGILVSQALNGYDALVQIEDKSFNLILMDIQMPGMDGYETAAKIKERLPKIPIIALTGEMGAEGKCETSTPMDDYMMKPFAKERLLAMMEKWRYLRVLNREDAMARLNGNIQLFNKLLQMFAGKMPDLKKMLANGVSGDERNMLSRELHKLKSSGLGLGAEEFYFSSGKLEMLLEAGMDATEERRELAGAIDLLIEEIERIIKNERDTVQNTGR